MEKRTQAQVAEGGQGYGTGRPPPLTSSPFWILRLELMIILCPLSKVTTSATQLGAQEWLMYLETPCGRVTVNQPEERAECPVCRKRCLPATLPHPLSKASARTGEAGSGMQLPAVSPQPGCGSVCRCPCLPPPALPTPRAPASPCRPSRECRIDDMVIVHAEHVHATVLKRVGSHQ